MLALSQPKYNLIGIMRLYPILGSWPLIAMLQSCVPIDSSYTPTYSIYQPPLAIDYNAYHKHGEHHHHHDHKKGDHYHPKNQWDKIAYKTVNANVSPQDIQNLNAITAQKLKKP